MEKKEKSERNIEEKEKVSCNDAKCPFHGNLKARGRVFEGIVKKKFPKRIVIEFERTIYNNKYERYMKKKTKIHARLSDCINVNVGDLIRIRECKPLSKIIHFVVVEKLKDREEDLK